MRQKYLTTVTEEGKGFLWADYLGTQFIMTGKIWGQEHEVAGDIVYTIGMMGMNAHAQMAFGYFPFYSMWIITYKIAPPTFRFSYRHAQRINGNEN